MKLEFDAAKAHVHQCFICNVVWAHDPRVPAAEKGYPANRCGIDIAYDYNKCYRCQYNESHACPKCGMYETVCADPSLTPDYFWDGKTKIKWSDYVRAELGNDVHAGSLPSVPDTPT